MLIWVMVVSALLTWAVGNFVWKRRFWYMAAWKLQGPLALPLIGNAWMFMCRNEEILMRIYAMTKQYREAPVRFWLGPTLLIMLPHPNHLEKILSSSKFAYKHDIYELLKIFMGEGLITGSGPLNKQHRHAILPIINLNFAKDSVVVIQKHVDRCMDQLDAHVDRGVFDAESTIHKCMIDANKELILGVSEQSSQLYGYSTFDQVLIDMYNFAFSRLVKPYLQPDLIFNLTPYKKRQESMLRTLRIHAKQTVQESLLRRKRSQINCDFYPLIDRIADFRDENPQAITDDVFLDHLLTLYAASEDPSTITCAFLALCFGMYPQYQEKAAREIREVFGDSPRPATWDDINRLKYMDMCIKDVLRLFPIAPIILRKCTADFQLDNKWLIPKNCGIALPIFSLHRDPRYWANPDHFHPDHFLPEAVHTRHVYAYLPFSAGSRGCIGKLLANTLIKVFMCSLLQHFEIETPGTLADLELKMDISTRPKRGYNLKLKRRMRK